MRTETKKTAEKRDRVQPLVRQDKPYQRMTPEEYVRDCMTFGSHEFQRVEEVKGEPDSEAVYVWKLPRP